MVERIRRNMELCFILIQTFLYISFLSLDISNGDVTLSAYLKFSVIILCFCYALLFARGADKSILFCMRGAFFFTVISDWFLLIQDHYLYGVITFIVVQQLYSIRIVLVKISQVENRKHRGEGNQGKANLLFDNEFLSCYIQRLFLQIAISLVVYLILHQANIMIDSLVLVSVFYFICITTNTISAVLLTKKPNCTAGNVLFAVGMVLFLLCDINVGIFNLSNIIVLPKAIYHNIYQLSSVLMWTFYAPAQTLLAISAGRMNVRKNETVKVYKKV